LDYPGKSRAFFKEDFSGYHIEYMSAENYTKVTWDPRAVFSTKSWVEKASLICST
jgi:hypothetical protein